MKEGKEEEGRECWFKCRVLNGLDEVGVGGRERARERVELTPPMGEADGAQEW